MSEEALTPLQRRIVRHMDQCRPRVLPALWMLYEDYPNAKVYLKTPGGVSALKVISEVALYESKHWLHVSCSARDMIPTWAELREVKDLFCGANSLALQILPPAAEYVNAHPNVLHLWVCLEGRPVPDFRKDGMI